MTDGRIIEVRAVPEPLMAVYGEDAEHLARLAWHAGNRHLPAMIKPGTIYLRPDHVIEEMLTGLGAKVESVTALFQPEGGAYGKTPDRLTRDGKRLAERSHGHG